MRELSAIDIRFLVKELQQAVGCRVDKLYAPHPEEIVLQLRKTGSPKAVIRCVVPDVIYLSSVKDEMPERPSGWCNSLRNLLEGAKIISVTQSKSERVVVFHVEKRDTVTHLYLEFYGKGNIVVTDEGDTIVAVLHTITHKDREVSRGVVYTLPQGPDAFHMAESEFVLLISAGGKNASTALSSAIGLGSFYAKELCARAGIDPKESLTVAHTKTLYSALTTLVQQEASPVVLIAGGAVVDVAPLPMNTFVSAEPVPSFSSAIEKIYVGSIAGDASADVTKAIDEQRTRLIKSIEAQQQSFKKLERDQQSAQRIGELLYENYDIFKKLLDEMVAARKSKTTAAFMKKYPKVKEYKEATGDIVVDVEDSQAS